MAENGNLNNNNNNIDVRGQNTTIVRSSITATTTTIANEISLDQGRTENDATHFRLRDVLQSSDRLTCLSCGETFECTSLLQVYEHYSEKFHERYYSNCLYCQGKVHQYFDNKNQHIHYYHNCLRWKRGENR